MKYFIYSITGEDGCPITTTVTALSEADLVQYLCTTYGGNIAIFYIKEITKEEFNNLDL